MKKVIVLLSALAIMLVPMTSFAETTTGTGIGGVKTTLPVYKLPELSSMEMPTLSKNYASMERQMRKLGFGEYRYEDGLPLPEVEAPTGTGTNAYDVFVGTYGDLWSDPSRQLDKSSSLPVEQVLNAASAFSLQAETSFNTIKTQDTATMSNLLSKKLDTSGNWDLTSIKSSLPSMSADEMNAYVSTTQKPAGYGGEAATVSIDDMIAGQNSVASALGVDAEGMRWTSGSTGGIALLKRGFRGTVDSVEETSSMFNGVSTSVMKTAKALSTSQDAKSMLSTLLGQ